MNAHRMEIHDGDKISGKARKIKNIMITRAQIWACGTENIVKFLRFITYEHLYILASNVFLLWYFITINRYISLLAIQIHLNWDIEV